MGGQVRAEAAAALVFALVAILTAVWPDWIELVFRVDPDHGDGGVEWAIVAVLAVLAIIMSAASWWHHGRLRPAG